MRSQVSSIIREGKRQRFCQQCGRFHDLTSFDGDKRSCRARLQRHNARRRKKTADVDAPSASKTATVKRQSSIGRGSRTDSSKKQQTSDSASVSPCPLRVPHCCQDSHPCQAENTAGLSVASGCWRLPRWHHIELLC